MKIPTLDEIALAIPRLDLPQLKSLRMAVEVAIQFHTQGTLSSDRPDLSVSDDEGPALHDEARMILEQIDRHELTLADQALLAALFLSDAYQHDSFSSRAINDFIEECGRPRIANITSAITGLTSRSFLHADDKALSLSKEGRAKARSLIGMLKRRSAAAA